MNFKYNTDVQNIVGSAMFKLAWDYDFRKHFSSVEDVKKTITKEEMDIINKYDIAPLVSFFNINKTELAKYQI